MRITNNDIFKMLQVTNGMEYSDSIIVNAIKMHQQKISISDVKF